MTTRASIEPPCAVAVIGAGTMGHGIAQVAAAAGFTVRLNDASVDALDVATTRIADNLAGGVKRRKLSAADAEATLRRITTAADLRTTVREACLVVEAVREDLGTKRELFAALDSLAPADAVLATNTSSLSVTMIAAATSRPSRVVGIHFFNPVHIMKLVEIVGHERADPAYIEAAARFTRTIGKTAIIVRDSPGFASSRLGVVLGLEAMRMLEQGVASAQDIDTAMELGYGHPMGPLRVTDVVGLDVRLQIAEYLHRELNASQFEPPAILRDKVAKGELGKKTGRGFYDWPS
jgi:3-hydroxybutyryl-CoA dehydrogenase